MVQSNSNGGSTATEILRPSSERRKRLQEVDAGDGTVPSVSNFFPIERYYDASDKVFASFQTAYERRRLDEAFVYGFRYSRFCMEGITQHDYYNGSKYRARKLEMGKRIAEVIGKLEEVAQWMDAEELEKEAKRQEILRRQQEERRRKQQELDRKRFEELQKRIEQQKSSSSSTISAERLEESALAKLQRLAQPQLIPHPTPVPPQLSKKVSWVLPPEPEGQLLTQFNSDSIDLPPPLLPPSDGDESASQFTNGSAPPSYSSILKQSSYFGPGLAPIANESQPSAPSYDQTAMIPKKKQKLIPIRQFISQTQAKHKELLQQRKIEISALRTYQGRVSGSTNGCTVISACCVSRHMETHGGITDDQITAVIDRDSPPLLKAIRSREGLGGASLIIPSDVHDYLVDHKLLHQHKFVGAMGGNIVDPEHSGELINLLKGEPGKTSHLKAAATLFFREHVISIVKFPSANDDAVYDMIDSLPTCNGRGSRTRCHGSDALKVHLDYYCTLKLSDSNIIYIERNKWDDAMADFDPRVFQAFVWADLPQPATKRVVRNLQE